MLVTEYQPDEVPARATRGPVVLAGMFVGGYRSDERERWETVSGTPQTRFGRNLVVFAYRNDHPSAVPGSALCAWV
jgi:hypothetical protein